MSEAINIKLKEALKAQLLSSLVTSGIVHHRFENGSVIQAESRPWFCITLYSVELPPNRTRRETTLDCVEGANDLVEKYMAIILADDPNVTFSALKKGLSLEFKK